MKKIICLILAVIMVSFVFASCGGGGQNDSSTTTTTTTKKQEEIKAPAEYQYFTIDFDGVELMDDIVVPDGFRAGRGGDTYLDGEAVKIGYTKKDGTGEGKNGLFNIYDDELMLDERFDTVTISCKWTIDKLPDAGQSKTQISVVSPIYTSEYPAVDAAGNEREDGVYYQFFLKIDHEGKLFCYDAKRWTVAVTTPKGDPVKLEEGKTYELKCEFQLGGTTMYTVTIDGQPITSNALSYTYMEDDTKEFYIRFGDQNGKYQWTFDDITIEAVPAF